MFNGQVEFEPTIYLKSITISLEGRFRLPWRSAPMSQTTSAQDMVIWGNIWYRGKDGIVKKAKNNQKNPWSWTLWKSNILFEDLRVPKNLDLQWTPPPPNTKCCCNNIHFLFFIYIFSILVWNAPHDNCWCNVNPIHRNFHFIAKPCYSIPPNILDRCISST